MILRYWSWTNSTTIPPVEPPPTTGGGGNWQGDKVLTIEEAMRQKIRSEDELLLYVDAAFITIQE